MDTDQLLVLKTLFTILVTMAREISGKLSLESDKFFVGSTRTDSADSLVTDSAAGINLKKLN
jgi:hypothetical protein